jgi:hypothetical protein
MCLSVNCMCMCPWYTWLPMRSCAYCLTCSYHIPPETGSHIHKDQLYLLSRFSCQNHCYWWLLRPAWNTLEEINVLEACPSMFLGWVVPTFCRALVHKTIWVIHNQHVSTFLVVHWHGIHKKKYHVSFKGGQLTCPPSSVWVLPYYRTSEWLSRSKTQNFYGYLETHTWIGR